VITVGSKSAGNYEIESGDTTFVIVPKSAPELGSDEIMIRATAKGGAFVEAIVTLTYISAYAAMESARFARFEDSREEYSLRMIFD